MNPTHDTVVENFKIAFASLGGEVSPERAHGAYDKLLNRQGQEPVCIFVAALGILYQSEPDAASHTERASRYLCDHAPSVLAMAQVILGSNEVGHLPIIKELAQCRGNDSALARFSELLTNAIDQHKTCLPEFVFLCTLGLTTNGAPELNRYSRDLLVEIPEGGDKISAMIKLLYGE
jgi:hypothetical protein